MGTELIAEFMNMAPGIFGLEPITTLLVASFALLLVVWVATPIIAVILIAVYTAIHGCVELIQRRVQNGG